MSWLEHVPAEAAVYAMCAATLLYAIWVGVVVARRLRASDEFIRASFEAIHTNLPRRPWSQVLVGDQVDGYEVVSLTTSLFGPRTVDVRLRGQVSGREIHIEQAGWDAPARVHDPAPTRNGV